MNCQVVFLLDTIWFFVLYWIVSTYLGGNQGEMWKVNKYFDFKFQSLNRIINLILEDVFQE